MMSLCRFARLMGVGLAIVLSSRVGVVQTARAELVAHWPLNEGSGSVFEDVVGDHDGFLPLGEFEEQTEIEWAAGPPTQDHAVEFLGANSFIATDFPGIEGDGARTVTFWFRTEFDDSAYFLGWGANAESEKWHIRLNGAEGVMRTEFQGGQNFASINLIDDEWHHVASVFPNGASEGEEILHYVDGELDEQVGGLSLPIDTAIGEGDFDWSDAESFDPYPVHFGGVLAHGFNRSLEGLMADVRIYDEGLSQERIQSIMNGTDPGGVITDPLVPLNDGSLSDLEARIAYVHDELNSWLGDSNLDGEFNSSDFVIVFSAGKFETADSATWEQGDWNGDMSFNSSDFVAAFTDGGYENGPRPAINAVPEPTSVTWCILMFAWLTIGSLRQQIRP